MLHALLSDNESDDEVAGFNFNQGWPGVRVVSGPIPKLEDFDVFLSSGHTSGNIKAFYEPGDLNN